MGLHSPSLQRKFIFTLIAQLFLIWQLSTAQESPFKQPLVDATCQEISQIQPSTDEQAAEQWNLVNGNEELAQFEDAFDHNGRLCSECRGLSIGQCRKIHDGDLPDLCGSGLYDSAGGNWTSAALIWFTRDEPSVGEVCDLGSRCFEVPDCEGTHGPASHLILKSVRHVYDVFDSMQSATLEARDRAMLRNSVLFDQIAWVAHSTEMANNDLFNSIDNLIVMVSITLSMITWTVPGVDIPLKAIAWGGFFFGHYIPRTVVDGINNHMKSTNRLGELKESWFNWDLEYFAYGFNRVLEDITNPLFQIGYIGNSSDPSVRMSKVIENGMYTRPKHSEHEAMIDHMDKNLMRALILTEYDRQAFTFFFTPCTNGLGIPSYLDVPHGYFEPFCNREHDVTEWTINHHEGDSRPKHCEGPGGKKLDVPLAKYGEAFERNGTWYRPMVARPTPKWCYTRVPEGANNYVLNGSFIGPLKYKELMEPILNRSLLADQGILEPDPATFADNTSNPLNLVQYYEKRIWPICDWKDWAQSHGKIYFTKKGCPDLGAGSCAPIT